MDVSLTIDRGNTALKGALWDSEGALLRHCVKFDEAEAKSVAEDLVSGGDVIRGVAYCTVRSENREGDLASLGDFGVPVLNLTSETAVPLEICYATPATLGADRVAAAVGAMHYAAGRAVLVADVGTAVTYDFVDAEGRFLGGNIAPGISMRLAALHAHTSALPEVNAYGPAPIWGKTTEEALRSGTLRGVAAELEYYRRAAGADALTVLTGGSASILAKAGILDFEYILDPWLVLRGLYRILKYNEN